MEKSFEIRGVVLSINAVNAEADIAWVDSNTAKVHITGPLGSGQVVISTNHSTQDPVYFDGMSAFPVLNKEEDPYCFGFDLSESHASDAKNARVVIYEWARELDETVYLVFGDPPIWPLSPDDECEERKKTLLGKVYITTSHEENGQAIMDRLKEIGVDSLVALLQHYKWTSHHSAGRGDTQHIGPIWWPEKEGVVKEAMYYTHTLVQTSQKDVEYLPGDIAIGPDGKPRMWGNHEVLVDAARERFMLQDKENMDRTLKPKWYYHDVGTFDVPSKGGLTTTHGGPRTLKEIIEARNKLFRLLSPCTGEGSFSNTNEGYWNPDGSLEMLYSTAGTGQSFNGSFNPMESNILVDYSWAKMRELRYDNAGLFRFWPKEWSPGLSHKEVDQLFAYCCASGRMMTLSLNGEAPEWQDERRTVNKIIMGAVFHRDSMERELESISYFDGEGWNNWRKPSKFIRIKLKGSTIYVNLGSDWSSVPDLPLLKFGQYSVIMRSDKAFIANNIAIERGPYFDYVAYNGSEMIDGRDVLTQWGWHPIPNGKLMVVGGFSTSQSNTIVM